MSTQATDMTIRRSVKVNRSVEDAFALFTDGIGSWWPLESHSIGSGRDGVTAETAILEGGEGGRLYERMSDGAEASWGAVVAWEPPHRVVISWHVNPKRTAATEVEVRFAPDGDGTRVELEHRGWERLGAEAEDARSGYSSQSGWEAVLARYVEVA
ncbi:MAG: SRPBCC family protein [Actinomycetota bacterium]|nr:SRPBCC family protein [Actinomycetota bacterium]